jgi:hypothetical protein
MDARKSLILLSLLAALAALAVPVVGAAADEHDHAAAAGPAALDRFRALAGEWVAAEDGEMVKKGDLVARYQLTAAGSAVVETVFPGTPHEMVTVYHGDGEDVVLTHYCLEGNQPRMRARGAGAGDRIDFAFDGGTNIDPATSKHMHSASFRFLGPDEIESEWTEIERGQPVFVVKTRLQRKAG